MSLVYYFLLQPIMVSITHSNFWTKFTFTMCRPLKSNLTFNHQKQKTLQNFHETRHLNDINRDSRITIPKAWMPTIKEPNSPSVRKQTNEEIMMTVHQNKSN